MDVKFKGETITTMNLVANNNVARSDVEYYIEKQRTSSTSRGSRLRLSE